MNIVVPVELSGTADVEIGADEIREAIANIEPAERPRQVLFIMNDFAKVVRLVDDKLIAELTLAQRQTIINFLRAQIERFDAPASLRDIPGEALSQ